MRRPLDQLLKWVVYGVSALLVAIVLVIKEVAQTFGDAVAQVVWIGAKVLTFSVGGLMLIVLVLRQRRRLKAQAKADNSDASGG